MTVATRLARVPAVLTGVASVSWATIATSSTRTPSSSATTCASVVAWPCPWLGVPTAASTPPVGSTCSRTASCEANDHSDCSAPSLPQPAGST